MLGDVGVEGAKKAIKEWLRDNAIPRFDFELTGLADLEDSLPRTCHDVLGVFTEIGDVQTFRAGSVSTRNMVLADQSGRSIDCLVYGQPTQTIQVGDVVVCKDARLTPSVRLAIKTDAWITKHADMKELRHVVGNSEFRILDEANNLLGWWQHVGQNMTFSSMSHQDPDFQSSASGAASGS